MMFGGKMFFRKKQLDIGAPVSGEILSLENVPDDVFSKGILGKGIAIIPKEGEIYAPVSGIITSFFPTSHAIGITTEDGVELLIHVGINTVNLGGVGFETRVSEGVKVKKGSLMLEVDIQSIKRWGYNIVTPIVVCNPDKFKGITYMAGGEVNKGDVIMRIEL